MKRINKRRFSLLSVLMIICCMLPQMKSTAATTGGLLLGNSISGSAETAAQDRDAEEFAAFMEYMKGKAASIGMSTSIFKDPVGMNNVVTANDLMRLMVYAYSNYETLNPVWGEKDRTISVEGPENREYVMHSGY